MAESANPSGNKKYVVVELRSYSDGNTYNLVIGGQFEVLKEFDLPFHENFHKVLMDSMAGYMPVQTYDSMGSCIRQFANNYIRITHTSNFAKSEEKRPIMREQLSDMLLNSGWTLLGFAVHQGPVPGTSAIIEKWKKEV